MEANKCHYYHGNIDGHEAESRLIKYNGPDGSFLIRDSGSKKGVYILCLLVERKLFQYRILTDKNGLLSVESSKNSAVRQTSSLSELVEYYLSKGAHNGLKFALVKGVRPNGIESDSESEDDETYVDTKYVFGLPEKDSGDSIISGVEQPSSAAANIRETHLYDQPDENVLPEETLRCSIKDFYMDQLNRTNCSKVSGEFVKKVHSYVEHDLLTDTFQMSTEESKLSSNHLHKLKDLIRCETTLLQRHLDEFIHKIDFLRYALARRGAVLPSQQKRAHIESESPFNTLVGLLSHAKQELCTLEMETVNSFNDMVGYSNVDPLAAKKISRKPDIPAATFQVRAAGKALLSSSTSFTLRVDLQKGVLNIVKDNSQNLDASNTYSPDKIMQLVKSTQNSRVLEVLIDGRRKDVFFFDDIRHREHFCQLVQQLKKVHNKETMVNSICIYCGTWNMGNELPPQLDGLNPWLRCQGVGKTRVTTLATEPHDLYAFGTQEAKVSEKDWVNKLKRMLHNHFNMQFHVVAVCTLWQIRLVIFVKPEHKNRVSRVQQAVVRTGIANALGNKGAATISLDFDGTSLCFICCHLAANQERLARRNQNSKDILKSLASSIGTKAFSDFDITHQFHHVFCMGDLNYRVEGEVQAVLNLAENEQYAEMLQMDQLLQTINAQKAFYGFDEELITFAPTYRYSKNENKFNWKKQKSSGVKINVPSWCDRVLWTSLPNCDITNTSYGLVRDVTTSDHKPVFASFTLQVLPQNVSRSVHSITTPIEIRLSQVSCELLAEESSDKQADFCLTVMGSCLEGSCESRTATSGPLAQGKDGIRWSDTLVLKPTFSDASHLQTQHILIAVKNITEGMVVGDTAISLLNIFQDMSECGFQGALTSLGGRTGSISGYMQAIVPGVAKATVSPVTSKPPKLSVSRNIVVTDIYASPLSALSWDEESNYPLIDTTPRVRGEPMSFVANKQKMEMLKRSLPRPPGDYQVPPPAVTVGAVAKGGGEEYRNAPPRNDYYNVNKAPVVPQRHPQTEAVPPPTAVEDEEEGEYYEDAELAVVSPTTLPARGEGARPKVPARLIEPHQLAASPAFIQGAGTVTSWLLSHSMPQYSSMFKKNGWTTLQQVSRLNRDQLLAAGVKVNHVFLILDAIRQL